MIALDLDQDLETAKEPLTEATDNVSNMDVMESMQRKEVLIIGVGGAGNNTLDRIALSQVSNSHNPGNSLAEQTVLCADLVSMNTDSRDLAGAATTRKVPLGQEITHGLGTGGDPALGKQSAEAVREKIRQIVAKRRMVVLCAGLGGGTGSGATPVIAQHAKEAGAFVVSFLTLPFPFEGERRMDQALQSYHELKKISDSVVIFENQHIGENIVGNASIQEAFAAADDLLCAGILSMIEVSAQPGLIRIGMDEFSKAVGATDSDNSEGESRCLFGYGSAKGKNRAEKALDEALRSPMFDKGKKLKEAEHVLINISGNQGLKLFEVESLMHSARKQLKPETELFFGASTNADSSLGDSLRVTIITSLPCPSTSPSKTKPTKKTSSQAKKESKAKATKPKKKTTSDEVAPTESTQNAEDAQSPAKEEPPAPEASLKSSAKTKPLTKVAKAAKKEKAQDSDLGDLFSLPAFSSEDSSAEQIESTEVALELAAQEDVEPTALAPVEHNEPEVPAENIDQNEELIAEEQSAPEEAPVTEQIDEPIVQESEELQKSSELQEVEEIAAEQLTTDQEPSVEEIEKKTTAPENAVTEQAELSQEEPAAPSEAEITPPSPPAAEEAAPSQQPEEPSAPSTKKAGAAASVGSVLGILGLNLRNKNSDSPDQENISLNSNTEENSLETADLDSETNTTSESELNTQGQEISNDSEKKGFSTGLPSTRSLDTANNGESEIDRAMLSEQIATDIAKHQEQASVQHSHLEESAESSNASLEPESHTNSIEEVDEISEASWQEEEQATPIAQESAASEEQDSQTYSEPLQAEQPLKDQEDEFQEYEDAFHEAQEEESLLEEEEAAEPLLTGLEEPTGHFEGSEATVYNGQNLDTPAYLRRRK